jgi:hypothetical protein
MVRERRAAPVREDDVIVPARQQLKRVENRGGNRQSHGVGYSRCSQSTHKQLPGSLPLCDIPVSRIAGAELAKARATRCECCTADSTQLTRRSTYTAWGRGSHHTLRVKEALVHPAASGPAQAYESTSSLPPMSTSRFGVPSKSLPTKTLSQNTAGRYFAFGQPCLSLNMSTTLQVSAEPPPQLPTTRSAWFIP